MIVRLATADDDTRIAELMERIPMPGAMQLAFGCRPSFFQALRVEGGEPLVVVAEGDGGILGVGAVVFRKVYFNGRVATLRYLSGLRVAPEARGSSVMARGFARLRSELAGRPGEITLTSILADNTAALRLLARSRPAAPVYQLLGRCVTRVVTSARVATVGTVASPAGDAEEIAGFLNRHGPSRNFFPVCRAGDLDGGADPAFPGLTAGNFMVVREGGEVRGVMGCWNVMRFRQALVAGYGGVLRWVRPWYNLGARCARRPLLPAVGQPVRLAYAALALVRDSEPRVFRSLLNAGLVWARQQGLDYLVVALAAGDPLAAAFSGLPCRELHSRIFQVEFEKSPSATGPDERQAHFEAAML